MKKLILTFLIVILGISVYGQNKFKYPIEVGTVGGTNGKVSLKGSTSGQADIQVDNTGNLSLPATTSIGDVDATEISYVNNARSELQAQIDDTVSLSTIVPLLTDTIPLATFGAGLGLAADTACFNNGVLIGSFYNEGSDTLVITQLMGVMKEGTGTETISVQFSWHATFLSGSATNLNAAALAITSLTTGTVDVAFSNSKIPPNVFVWGILSGASKDNKPTFLSVTLSGYKIPTY